MSCNEEDNETNRIKTIDELLELWLTIWDYWKKIREHNITEHNPLIFDGNRPMILFYIEALGLSEENFNVEATHECETYGLIYTFRDKLGKMVNEYHSLLLRVETNNPALIEDSHILRVYREGYNYNYWCKHNFFINLYLLSDKLNFKSCIIEHLLPFNKT